MFQYLSIFAILVAAAQAVTEVEWIVYKAKHTKVYDKEQDYFRRMIYEENLKKIQEHNVLYAKGLSSFFMKENEFADKTHSEFVKTMNGYRPPMNKGPRKSMRRFNVTSLPDEINWVKKGYVAEVKNQGECGSCWSFSATGAMEGAHKKATGNLVSLSEQNLIDCSFEYGNEGCNGGVVDYAFQYVIDNKGDDTEASYPYKGEENSCNFKPSDVGAKLSSFKDVEQDSEPALQEATANIGPVSVAIDASHESLQLYGGGVYDEAACTINVDHAVLVVGYGALEGKDYWLVKNSWGASWGLDGYVMMSRNKNNQCGIASQACYPIA